MRASQRLSLVLSERVIQAEMGEGKARRLFLDFEVDGELLYPIIRGAGIDNITPLWLGSGAATAAETVGRLLGQEPGDAPRGRVSVYVCAECGDVGCGAVTVELTVHPDAVTWSDWGFQTNNEEEVHQGGVPSFGTLTFDRAEYEALLQHALDRIASDR